MRTLIALAAVTVLSACASQGAAPAKAPEKAVAAPAEKTAPQCWSGDAGKFFAIGARQTVSGVAVECKPTSDGKAAAWVGAK